MKKSVLYDRAEELYVQEQWTFETIAKELSCSDRTLRNWAKDGRWDLKRKRQKEVTENLHDATREIAMLLAEKITGQLTDGKVPAAHVLNAFTRMASTLLEAKKYERELDAEAQSGDNEEKNTDAAKAKFKEVFGVDLNL